MPKFDGTGPASKGPKTGRGLGQCNDSDEKTSVAGVFGFGRGLGLGRRQRNRRRFRGGRS
jgi:hypothetical protein